jgi:hypothetical protein
MTPEQKNRLFILFTGHSAEVLTAEEHAELQNSLRSDAEARRLWFVHQDVEAGIHARVVAAPVATTVRVIKPMRWTSRRPMMAAAAGLAIGLFSATLVLGYGAQLRVRMQTLLAESFEDEALPLQRGVPSHADVWSGDLRAVESGEVKAAAGQRMAGLPPVENRKFSYAFRILDLTALPPTHGGEVRQIEVTAKFHAPAQGMRDRYQIRLAAFAEDAAGARQVWVDNLVNEMALMHVVKTAKSEQDAQGWATVRSLIDLPAEARVLLISLAAGLPGEPGRIQPAGDHYLDDVQVKLLTHETLP